MKRSWLVGIGAGGALGFRNGAFDRLISYGSLGFGISEVRGGGGACGEGERDSA